MCNIESTDFCSSVVRTTITADKIFGAVEPCVKDTNCFMSRFEICNKVYLFYLSDCKEYKSVPIAAFDYRDQFLEVLHSNRMYMSEDMIKVSKLAEQSFIGCAREFGIPILLGRQYKRA